MSTLARNWAPFPLSWHKLRTEDPILYKILLELHSRVQGAEAYVKAPNGRVTLSHGQCVLGRKELALWLGVTPKTIRCALERGANVGAIVVERSSPQGTVVTLPQVRAAYDGMLLAMSGVGANVVHPSKYIPCTPSTSALESKDDAKSVKTDKFVRVAVAYLNSITGRNFQETNESTVKNLRAVMKRGYSAEKVLAVIDSKFKSWKDDSKMKTYLVPGTLFRLSNFERYADELQANGPPPDRKTDEHGRFVHPVFGAGNDW